MKRIFILRQVVVDEAQTLPDLLARTSDLPPEIRVSPELPGEVGIAILEALPHDVPATLGELEADLRRGHQKLPRVVSHVHRRRRRRIGRSRSSSVAVRRFGLGIGVGHFRKLAAREGLVWVVTVWSVIIVM